MEVDIIYNKSCVKMEEIDNDSIDLIVTSPPYDNLREYGGYEFDFEPIAQELYRVTKNGGVVVWIVGDATIKGSETGTSFKQALYFKRIGFNLHDTMIYAKNNPIPLTHNRYEQQFEYMFVFSKGKPKTINHIKCPTITGGRIENNINRKHSDSIRRRDEIIVRKIERIKGNIWFYSLALNDKTSHTAPFPEQLANDHIVSWSNENDIVLDPMFGSGTTLKMAKKNNRRYIGYEINKEYCRIAEQRLEAEKTLWD